MASWEAFAAAEPELAACGAERLHGRVAYLATVRGGGLPRVHPVTPIVGGGRLFLFMEPTSPKGHDLRRDGRYALHSSVEDNSGTGGEFLVRGRAVAIDEPATREVAAGASTYPPDGRYVLFAFEVDEALATVYEQGRPVRRRWAERG